MDKEQTQAHVVHVQVDEAYAGQVDTEDVRQIALRTLEAEHVPAGELTIVITGEDTVRELNRTYRGVDAPTDVLSFPMGEDAFLPEEETPYLGDIVIALPVAEAQARAYGHPLQEELRLLVVHGVLHLLGYDHATPEEEAEMWQKQERILGKAYLGPGGTRRPLGD